MMYFDDLEPCPSLAESPDDVPRAEYDAIWKETLRQYLPESIELFFPEIAAAVDWDHEHFFLDKELEKIAAEAHTGPLRADILVRVRRRDGSDALVNLHAEVQSQPDRDLNQRMFRYWTRITETLREPTVSVALLGYLEPGPPAGRHREELWGCQAGFNFPVCRLADPPGGRESLETSDNPVALVALAHISAIQTRGDMELRAEEKWRLFRQLYGRGLDKQGIRRLMRLLDWLLRLPREKELSFTQRVVEFDNQTTPMEYITSFERFGIERGIAEVACRLARKLFLLIMEEEEKTIKSLPVEDLRELTEVILDFRSREDFLRWLEAHKPAAQAKEA